MAICSTRRCSISLFGKFVDGVTEREEAHTDLSASSSCYKSPTLLLGGGNFDNLTKFLFSASHDDIMRYQDRALHIYTGGMCLLQVTCSHRWLTWMHAVASYHHHVGALAKIGQKIFGSKDKKEPKPATVRPALKVQPIMTLCSSTSALIFHCRCPSLCWTLVCAAPPVHLGNRSVMSWC